MRNLLKEEIPDWATASDAIGVDPRARAEELTLEQWIALSNLAPSGAVPPEISVASERFPVVDEQDRVLGDAPTRRSAWE